MSTDNELVLYIGVNKKTVSDWKHGRKIPGAHRAKYLRNLYITACFKKNKNDVSDAAATCALCTCSIDNTDPIFRTAIKFADMMTVYNMVGALCVKFAHRITTDLHLNCIPRVEYNYGAWPARIRLTLQFIKDSSKKIEFVFTHTTTEPVMYIVHMLTYIQDRKHNECTFVANDAALITITSRTIKFLKSKTYVPGR